MTFFTTPELLEIGDIPMTSMYEKPTRTEASNTTGAWPNITNWIFISTSESIRSTAKMERLRFLPPITWAHSIVTERRKLSSPPAITMCRICLNVPGEELPKVIHYYKEPHPYYNHDVLVVGAKNSAAIAALELYWTGARVTLVHRGPAFTSM